MIDKRIVGTCDVTIPIHKGVLPHVAIAEPTWIWKRTDRALKLDLFPAAIEKPLIVWKIRIATYKIGACAYTIVPDDIRQGWLEYKRLIRRPKIVQI